MTKNMRSFMAASVFPAKVLQSHDVLVDGILRPVHLQLNPTNRCNLKCPWCSCANRDVHMEQSWPDIQDMLRMFARLGSKAATITGGGEPLLHPQINEMIDLCHSLGIQVGLVSNGVALDRLQTGNIIWSRLSFSDSRDYDQTFEDTVTSAARRFPDIDWAFSYVVQPQPKIEQIKTILALADSLNFTHVRLVSDLLDLAHAPDMDIVRNYLQGSPGEELVIYQGRKDSTLGTPRCLISLIKPVIGADGNLYPCCGTQYAMADPSLDYEKAMCFGNWRDWPRIMKAQAHFDGSNCVTCYYSNYNEALDILTSELQHMPFV